MTKDQEVLMAVVLDYLQTSQKDARQSKATNWTKHLVRICKQKRPQPWSWAQAHEERVRKHWNWKLLDAKWEKTKAQYTRCVPCCSVQMESVWVRWQASTRVDYCWLR
jgi:hypothetical protein